MLFAFFSDDSIICREPTVQDTGQILKALTLYYKPINKCIV